MAALAILCMAACHKMVDSTTAHRSKLDAMGGRGLSREQGDSLGVNRITVPDTVVFVSAVEFGSDYDWRRDTSYGAVTARIVLFRDAVRVLEIETDGVRTSADADFHHLLGGHIYTEGCDRSHTYVGRDGETLFSYSGRELICGLIPSEEGLYTLGQSRSGKGLSLRLNGEMLFEDREGSVSSRMSDSPLYPTGALYKDGEHMYFSYSRPITAGGQGKAWFVVEDGRETQILSDLEGKERYDIRVRSGDIEISSISSGDDKRCYSYEDGPYRAMLCLFQDWTFSFSSMRAVIPRRFSRTYFMFSWRNAALLGKSGYCAVTPMSEGSQPYLWHDGYATKLPLNGFLTAVEVMTVGE